MARFFRSNGLTIALASMFLLSVFGMIWSGYIVYSDDLKQHGSDITSIFSYLMSGNFLSALFENWESEFLQMAVYVILTAMLFQKGSAESRDPDNPDRSNDEVPAPRRQRRPILSWLYSYSLGITLSLLFVVSFILHGWASAVAANEDALRHGTGQVHSLAAYLFDARFWFESFQNWQSEFLSTAVLVVLSIYLRHKGSPESKPVGAANARTGA